MARRIVKAWTARRKYMNQNYFVAINYCIRDKKEIIHLVSVLDGKIRLSINIDDLFDSSQWCKGWIDIENDETSSNQCLKFEDDFSDQCLYVSSSSGLTIPVATCEIWDWF